MRGSRHDSSVLREDRRLLIGRDRKGLGLLIPDDELLVRLIEWGLITKLDEDQARQSTISLKGIETVPWKENRDGERDRRHRGT